MAEQRRRTGLTSGINLLTRLLIQSNEDELTRQRRAEDLRAQTEQRFQEEIGLRKINRGIDPITGQAIPGLQPQAVTSIPGLEPTGQTFDEFGNLKGTSFGRPFRTSSEDQFLPFQNEQDLRFDPTFVDLEGFATGSMPADPKARNTLNRLIQEGTIKTRPQGAIPLETQQEGGLDVMGGVRSLGQTILPEILRNLTGGVFPPRQAVSAIPSVSPAQVRPLPTVSQAQEGSGDLVGDARQALDEGFTPQEIMEELINQGLDPETARQIVDEASQ